MKTTLTITNKGQTTLPVAIRRLFGLSESGGVLTIDFDEHKGQAIIKKAQSIEELSTKLTSYIKPGTKPLLNVDEYYQAHRTPRT